MSTTLLNINNLVNDRRRDTASDAVDMTQNGFRAVNGTLQLWNQFHDWPWQLESTILNYNPNITTYSIPTSWDYKAIVNIRPQRQFEKYNELYYISQNKFDSDTIHAKRFAVRNAGQQLSLRMQYIGWWALFADMSMYNSNGTWIGAGAISNVGTDLFNFFEEPSSIQFDYSGTSGTLTNTTLSQMDLTRYVGRSSFFVNVELQSVTNFTGITLKVGSDASNYITISATTDYLGATPIVGWNKFAFAWTGTTTKVGTPVYTALDYAQFTMTYSGNPGTIRNNIENLFVSENVPMIVDYYSNNMVVTADGLTKTQIFSTATNTSDTPLWTGEWDFVNETFIDSTMSIVSYLTGEQTDEQVNNAKVAAYLEPLKARLPSKRRYPEYQMTPDLNGAYYGPRTLPYRPGWPGFGP